MFSLFIVVHMLLHPLKNIQVKSLVAQHPHTTIVMKTASFHGPLHLFEGSSLLGDSSNNNYSSKQTSTNSSTKSLEHGRV